MSLSREHVTHALYINMLYDVELYILKSNKIYVILCIDNLHVLSVLWSSYTRCHLNIFNMCLSYDVASGSEITPCNKICKPLVVYQFSGNVMTSITTLRT